MKIVAALDSFKGSLSSVDANSAVKDGALLVSPEINVITTDIADGGEGTCDIMTRELHGSSITIKVQGPLGSSRPLINATYGYIEDSNTAIIEMASAAGITLIDSKDRNPLNTTTYGVGEMILDSIGRGANNIILTIGGSSTNDCGIGMLTALGYKFIDSNGNTLEGFGRDLKDIVSIDIESRDKRIDNTNFIVMCDVDNPLTGIDGCSYVYGPQKGATRSQVEDMDNWISSFAKLVNETYQSSDPMYPGSGAAGGMGFATKTFLNALLRPGIEVIIEAINFEEKIKDADLVITGEGRIDEQSIHGKVIAGVTNIAAKHNIPVVALCGLYEGNLQELYSMGINEIINIHPEEDRNLPLEVLMSHEKSYEDIVNATRDIVTKYFGIKGK